ncbi:MAG: hypothetical protein ISS51_05465 [Dehalococcoidales bacterium]|nr:hypothetical protein [Dehalococcoidales bacterium]
MKVLKGLALGLLSFLLFLSLAVFGLALTINQTVLNPDFVVSGVNKLDMSSLAEEFLSEQIPLDGEQELVAGVLNDTIADLEPWIKEQASAVIYVGYDYLLGESQSLNLVISTEQLKETLRDNLKSAFKQSLPPEFAGLPQDMIDAEFDKYYQEFAEQIPPTFDLGENITPEVMTALEQARQIINYIQIAYQTLIALILVLITGIILIHRQVRGATRQLGITFLTYGVPGFASIFILKNYAMAQLTQLMTQPGFPASLQAWLPQLVDDFLAPLEMFSLGILIGGVALLVASFVYKPRETSL